MPESSTPPFHAGLTPEHIVHVARDLTRESHLYGWSIRDLARRLDVAPSVVYHHIGGKDLIARYVVERVLAELHGPDPALAWQEWFRTFLHSSYPTIVRYPGTAKWVLLHGPVFPSVIPIMDAGIAVLQRAGFGDDAGLAYAILLNNAMLTITLGDERLLHEDDGPRDHATMMAEFRRIASDSPAISHMATAFMAPFANSGAVAARQRENYYRANVEITIAGLESRLS